MEKIISRQACESLKRYWRRRRYRRLNSATGNRNNLRTVRLGRVRSRRSWRIRTVPKLHLKIVSPFNLLSKFHEAYVEVMMRLAGSFAKLQDSCSVKGKRASRAEQVSVASSGEEVDSRLVLEIYRRLSASLELPVF